MRLWQKLLIVLVVLVGASYFGRHGLVRVLDQHAYEPTLAACVAVLELVERQRLEIELRSYCNVHMVTMAATAFDQAAE